MEGTTSSRPCRLVAGSRSTAGAAVGGALLAGAATSSLAVASLGLVIAGAWAVDLVRVGGRSARAYVWSEGPTRSHRDCRRYRQETRYRRDAALRLLAAVLPRLNWRGDKDQLSAATRMVDEEEALAADGGRLRQVGACMAAHCDAELAAQMAA